MTLIFSLILLVIVFGVQIWRPELLAKHRVWIFGIAGAIVFLGAVIISHLQFVAWLNGGTLTRLLLPPHQSINYFFFYIFTKFWMNYLLSFMLALIFWGVAKYVNTRGSDKFFYDEEPYILGACILLVGTPGWMLYLSLVLVLYLLYSLFIKFFKKSNARVSFYYFWAPVAILLLLALPFIDNFMFFRLLQV